MYAGEDILRENRKNSMKRYSITKYTRINDREEDWTAISDIGKVYGGVRLNIEEYKKVEDAYVNSILQIIKYMKIDSLKMRNIVRWKDLRKELNNNLDSKALYSEGMLSIYENVNEDSKIDKEGLGDLIRLELREDIGGLLYVPYRLKIFIGYDFMMGVHTSMPLEAMFNKIEEFGLTIYRF